MKHLSVLMMAILGGLCLSSCSSQVPPTPSALAIVAGPLDTAAAYLAHGDQYFDLKDYDHAIADYSEAIRLKPDYAEAYNNRGLAFALSSKRAMASAIGDYSQAIQLRPEYAYVYNNRGVAYMASGQPDSALRDFNRAIQLQPNFPQAYSNRGNAFYRQGRIDLALADFYHAGTLNFIVVACGIPLTVLLLGIGIMYRVVRHRILAKKRGTLEIP
jgi:tetratricopeptide (TPR) repeat protein